MYKNHISIPYRLNLELKVFILNKFLLLNPEYFKPALMIFYFPDFKYI